MSNEIALIVGCVGLSVSLVLALLAYFKVRARLERSDALIGKMLKKIEKLVND